MPISVAKGKLRRVKYLLKTVRKRRSTNNRDAMSICAFLEKEMAALEWQNGSPAWSDLADFAGFEEEELGQNWIERINLIRELGKEVVDYNVHVRELEEELLVEEVVVQEVPAQVRSLGSFAPTISIELSRYIFNSSPADSSSSNRSMPR